MQQIAETKSSLWTGDLISPVFFYYYFPECVIFVPKKKIAPSARFLVQKFFRAFGAIFSPKIFRWLKYHIGHVTVVIDHSSAAQRKILVNRYP